MKAYVLTQRETLCEQNRPIPQPDKGEVVIRLERCGICRTDRKAYHTGQRDLHMPRVLGHEIAGTIVSVDSTVNTYQKGMRVAVHPGIFCGTCETCMTGKDQLCEAMQILGFHLDGGFQEYCLIPATGVKQGVILPLPDSLSFAKAVLAEPTLTVLIPAVSSTLGATGRIIGKSFFLKKLLLRSRKNKFFAAITTG